MEFDIEMWVPYRCDFKPITTNSLFSDALGHIAEMAMRLESEFLYMECGGACPVGTLVPENLIRPHTTSEGGNFAMVFSYSRGMERVLYGLVENKEEFGVGITVCGIWKSSILLEECKVLVVASGSPMFDVDEFLDSLGLALSTEGRPDGSNVPYFAEKFGYRRFSIPYETDNVIDLQISHLLMKFEFDETRRFVGSQPELSLDNF
ncbi:MAG: hypothetical protein LBQ58_11430 [Synergistaceae bacterium]|jgi:hypothetical protein|nr:hypothetical protein [Synergistaceae bacterium]